MTDIKTGSKWILNADHYEDCTKGNVHTIHRVDGGCVYIYDDVGDEHEIWKFELMDDFISVSECEDGMSKFKVGDNVRVIASKEDLQFTLTDTDIIRQGECYTIQEVDEGSYRLAGEEECSWVSACMIERVTIGQQELFEQLEHWDSKINSCEITLAKAKQERDRVVSQINSSLPEGYSIINHKEM